MIDSIYIGITGVQSHQERMTVIGNNVANINTTAFKGSRVAFSEVMSQTLSEGTAPRDQISATNPKQTGLGVGIASIDRIQTQGSLQLTGIDTDLAVEGDGLFVISDGTRDFYTRDGTFAFDTEGRLVDPSTGLIVKGNIAKDDGTGALNEISFDAELKELVVPLNRESEARATTQVQLAGNLDAAGGSPPVWSEDTIFGQPARHEGLNEGQLANLNGQLATADPGAAKLTVTIVEDGNTTGGTINVPIKDYTDIAQLRDELNALIYADDSLKGNVLFTRELVGGSSGLVLRSITGGENVSITVDDGGTSELPISSLLGFTKGGTEIGGSGAIGAGVELNSLANVGEALTDGDIIRFTGVKPSGERFDGELIFQATTRDTIDDLFAAVEDAYGGVTAGLDATTGKMILTTLPEEGANGQRVVGFDVTFSLLDAQTPVREERSALVGADAPFSFSTNTQIYDEQGESHSLTFTYTKGLVENEWHWGATIDGLTPDEGNVGTVTFLPDGTIDAFQATDGKNLSIAPTNGAGPISLDILATDPTGRLGGLTQFVAPSSMAVRDQDGRASGNLVSVSIEENGHIRGLFDNGDSQVFARVALATFGNPAGLRSEGANLFAETISSGTVRTGEATTEIQGTIRSGHIELSNVDLAAEFTSMIITQRGFQASARTITTSDELMNELVNLKR
ncbi:MAG: flagellar hook-basal body complex protein [Gemmatimonadetes bacterium]|jgi:flagellar hook protein FlgE|nr:flagellar hook-basal body complex protein [Gemmatimonadota bacterium]MBT7862878.1 flagellar hook-basal body complex protein [Gemmatimonadota bacterium]